MDDEIERLCENTDEGELILAYIDKLEAEIDSLKSKIGILAKINIAYINQLAEKDLRIKELETENFAFKNDGVVIRARDLQTRVDELESFIRRLSPEGNAMGVLSEAKKILGE